MFRHSRFVVRGEREYVCILLLLFLAGCGSTTITTNPPPPQPSISVVPKTALVPIGTGQPFFAAVANTPNNTVSWMASAGTIDQLGNYVAPASVPDGGIVTITASLVGNPGISASATAKISSQPVTLAISPLAVTVKAGLSSAFTGIVGGTTNTTVIWSASDLPGDNTYPGSFAGGVYTAPAPILVPESYLVTAVSSADPSKTASASVKAIPLENEEEQKFPIELGTSGVNANTQDCCSGTLGSLLVDDKGKQYILSNNHVIGRVGNAVPGEAIVQPGYFDTLCDLSAPKTVARFTAAPSILSNVDAAIAEVVTGAVDPSGGIIGLGGINADGSYITAPPANTIATAEIGMQLATSGRTTGLACGVVEAVNGTILIDLPAECGNPFYASVVFQGQVILNNIVKPGDSGSLIVEASTAEPLALVAGLSNDGQFATANPVDQVLTALNGVTGSTLNFVGAGQHPVTCSPSSSSGTRSSSSQSKKHFGQSLPLVAREEVARAIDVQSRYESAIMQIPAVLGVAVGRRRNDSGRAALLVFVEQGRERPSLPTELDGLAVQVVATGRFSTAILPPNAHSLGCRRRLLDPVAKFLDWPDL